MPLLLRVDELRPGMALAANAMNGLEELFPMGYELNEKDIEFLQNNYPDSPVTIALPFLDDLVKFEDNTRQAKASLEIRANIAQTFGQLSEHIHSGQDLTEETVRDWQLTIVKMLTSLQANPTETAVFDQPSGGGYLAEYTAKVFYLSVLIGDRIRSYIRQERKKNSSAQKVNNAMSLTPLAVGAFFHDIAMIELESLYRKRDRLTSSETQAIQAHPERGHKMLDDKISIMARQVILCHHENHDGCGYPEGLAGEKINVYARIVRAADAYCAATSSRIYQKARHPAAVLYEMAFGNYRNCYDPVVIAELVRLIQPFSIGSKIRLENGQTAVVIRHNVSEPFKPKVVVAFDKQGRLLPKKDIQKPFFLGQPGKSNIDSLGQEDLSFLRYADMSFTEKFPPAGFWRNCEELFDLAYP